MADAARLIATIARPIVDFALPPRCAGCGAIVGDPHAFCPTCWKDLVFLGEPCCDVCGLPFDHDGEAGRSCGACLADPPPFDRLRAAVAYGDLSRRVTLRLKYGGRPALAATLARLMRRHVEAESEALVAPVPLHRWRIWKRGYNQAALIAGHLSRLTGLPVEMALLERVKATPPLRGMNPRQRREALAGAFRLAPRQAERVRGRTVILVDDVHTSGATAAACARVLRKAGAARIEILCWARVLRLDPPGAPGR